MAIRPELRDELMKLSAEERLELAEELFESVPESDVEAPDLDPQWTEELARRVEEIRSGKVEGIPAEQVLAELRAQAAARRGE